MRFLTDSKFFIFINEESPQPLRPRLPKSPHTDPYSSAKTTEDWSIQCNDDGCGCIVRARSRRAAQPRESCSQGPVEEEKDRFEIS